MLFRGTLSNPPKAATRGKDISNRTYKKVKLGLKPILMIDIEYIAYLLESKSKYKLSKIYNIFNNKDILHAIKYNRTNSLSLLNKKTYYELKRIVYNILTNLINKSKTNKVILVYNSKETLVINKNINIILTILLKPFNFQYMNLEKKHRYCDYIYTFCKEHSHNLSEYLLIYVTNSLTTWACASSRLNHACILISRDDRAIIYNEKTGLDILARFVGTLHVINKLNLDICRNVNLQYLYLIIMFIRMLTESKKSTEYFFDSVYYKQFKNIDRDKFVGRNGKAYDLVTQANRNLSYIFFTFEEALDKFLLLKTNDFHNYVMTLRKSIDFDIDVMCHFQRFYTTKDAITLIQTDKYLLNIEQVIKPNTNNDNYYKKVLQSLSKFNNQQNKIVTALSKEELDSINKMIRELFR